MFVSNNGNGNSVNIKDIGAILDKDYEPIEYQIILITTKGKLTWIYTSKSARDEDVMELKRLRVEYQAKK